MLTDNCAVCGEAKWDMIYLLGENRAFVQCMRCNSFAILEVE